MNFPEVQYLLRLYGPHGLRAMFFPSNQFGGEGPGGSECEREYNAAAMANGSTTDLTSFYTTFDEVDVRGPNAAGAFRFCVWNTPSDPPYDHCGGCELTWNYEKFVLDASGQPVGRYMPRASPLWAESLIREALGLPAQDSNHPPLSPPPPPSPVSTRSSRRHTVGEELESLRASGGWALRA